MEGSSLTALGSLSVSSLTFENLRESLRGCKQAWRLRASAKSWEELKAALSPCPPTPPPSFMHNLDRIRPIICDMWLLPVEIYSSAHRKEGGGRVHPNEREREKKWICLSGGCDVLSRNLDHRKLAVFGRTPAEWPNFRFLRHRHIVVNHTGSKQAEVFSRGLALCQWVGISTGQLPPLFWFVDLQCVPIKRDPWVHSGEMRQLSMSLFPWAWDLRVWNCWLYFGRIWNV